MNISFFLSERFHQRKGLYDSLHSNCLREELQKRCRDPAILVFELETNISTTQHRSMDDLQQLGLFFKRLLWSVFDFQMSFMHALKNERAHRFLEHRG